MPRMDLQAKGDTELRNALREERVIKAAIEKANQDDQFGARRQLLATSIRLTKEMAPDVFKVLDECQRALELDGDLETYVYPAAAFNAAAVRPERGRLFIMVSSSLLEAFDDRELAFVLGHEFGHHMFDHHEIPVGMLLGGKSHVRAGLALQLFAWQRYAEISCDRAGMVCAGGLDPAASALFKLASGIRGDRIKVRVDQFLSQVRDLAAEGHELSRADAKPRSDWFSTHPFSPIRLQACDLFAKSDTMSSGGIPMTDIEQQVHELMSLMSPNYLQEKSEPAEAMRRLLFSGGVLIAAAHNEPQSEALEALEELLGPGAVPSEINTQAIRDNLPRRISAFVDKVPPLRRAQVIRDLGVIARADDRVSAEERQVLYDLARQVHVGVEVAAEMLASPAQA